MRISDDANTDTKDPNFTSLHNNFNNLNNNEEVVTSYSPRFVSESNQQNIISNNTENPVNPVNPLDPGNTGNTGNKRYDKFCNTNSNFWKTADLNYQNVNTVNADNTYKTETAKPSQVQNNNSFQMLKASKEITKNTFRKAFTIIFESLDYKKCKYISGMDNLDNSNLPFKVQELLMPFMSELEKQKETLNKVEFELACEDLLEVVSYILIFEEYGDT